MVVARPQGKDIEGEIEPAGPYHTYTNAKYGDVVFAPWKTVQRTLDR